jgi:hypothetical protein
VALANARELKQDVLFRASEPLTGSQWDAKVMDYLNRVYRTLSTGASEFLPEFVEDWWWMRQDAVLMLEPNYNTGLVAVTQGSTSITFTPAPASSLAGRRLRVKPSGTRTPDLYVIAAHTGGAGAATLDGNYTSDTNAAAPFDAMKTEYTLAAAVQVLMSPIVVFQEPNRLYGISPERMDELFPLARLVPGIYQAFALENEQVVRFSHGGRNDGKQTRAEYRYRPFITDLTDSTGSIPLVPTQWMHVLSDMALVYVLLDKNDDRSNAAALGARTGLAAMLKENRRRAVKIDYRAGHIAPRQTRNLRRGPLRTDSGLIIG